METQVHPVRFQRPKRAKIEQLKEIGSATLSAELKHKAGIRNSHIVGPVTQEKGRVIGGPAITLQFMPIREDTMMTNQNTRKWKSNFTDTPSTLQRLETWLL